MPQGRPTGRATMNTARTGTVAAGVTAATVITALLAAPVEARPNAKCEAGIRNGVTAITELAMCQRDVTFNGDTPSVEPTPRMPQERTFYDPNRYLEGDRFGHNDDWVKVTR